MRSVYLGIHVYRCRNSSQKVLLSLGGGGNGGIACVKLNTIIYDDDVRMYVQPKSKCFSAFEAFLDLINANFGQVY